MATNPKLPDFENVPRTRQKESAKVQMLPQSKFPWPLLALIAGAALLIAIIALLPRTPHVTKPPTGAEVPRQPTAEQIQLSKPQIVPAPAGDALYLTVLLHNTGNSEVTGVQIEGQFLGRNGEVLQSERAPIQAVSQDGMTATPLTQRPIKPNESRAVRVYFEHTPKGWNHELPQLTVTTVTGTTP
jgi:Protein of unknown function (DUF3426)